MLRTCVGVWIAIAATASTTFAQPASGPPPSVGAACPKDIPWFPGGDCDCRNHGLVADRTNTNVAICRTKKPLDTSCNERPAQKDINGERRLEKSCGLRPSPKVDVELHATIRLGTTYQPPPTLAVDVCILDAGTEHCMPTFTSPPIDKADYDLSVNGTFERPNSEDVVARVKVHAIKPKYTVVNATMTIKDNWIPPFRESDALGVWYRDDGLTTVNRFVPGGRFVSRSAAAFCQGTYTVTPDLPNNSAAIVHICDGRQAIWTMSWSTDHWVGTDTATQWQFRK